MRFAALKPAYSFDPFFRQKPNCLVYWHQIRTKWIEACTHVCICTDYSCTCSCEFSFRPNPTIRHSFWSLTIGSGFLWASVYGTNQAQVQRALTCGSLRDAQMWVWIGLHIDSLLKPGENTFIFKSVWTKCVNKTTLELRWQWLA